MDASDAAQEHLQALIGEWRMEVDFRGAPPLEGASAVFDFSQRFVGVFSEDRRTIEGRWETGTEDGDWQRDFGLIYTRV
ncbi:MAG TPA: hypothetical protein VII01_06400 [Solirubrobacteraceae bacterium]